MTPKQRERLLIAKEMLKYKGPVTHLTANWPAFLKSLPTSRTYKTKKPMDEQERP